jgi:hypothetical protein
MECGIWQQQQKIVKSITALRFCKLEHPATQHYFSGRHQSSHNLPLYSASCWTVVVTNLARRGENDHHGCTNGAINWHQQMSQACVCCTRHGQRHRNCQIDVSKYDPLNQGLGGQSDGIYPHCHMMLSMRRKENHPSAMTILMCPLTATIASYQPYTACSLLAGCL